jgi:hypothetical protein
LREPLEAPFDGTFILGAFGWPWLVPAVWNSYDQEWVVCHMQAQEMANGLDDRWLEIEREKALDLTGWLPVPPLPGGDVSRPANAESRMELATEKDRLAAIHQKATSALQTSWLYSGKDHVEKLMREIAAISCENV